MSLTKRHVYQFENRNVIFEGRRLIVLVDDNSLDLGLTSRHELGRAGNVELTELHNQGSQKPEFEKKQFLVTNLTNYSDVGIDSQL